MEAKELGLFKKKPRLEDEIYPNMAILQIIILKANKEIIFSKFGGLEGASLLFDNELTKDPNNLISLVGKGYILGELGRTQVSLICYNEALEMIETAESLLAGLNPNSNVKVAGLSSKDAGLIRGIENARYDFIGRFGNYIPFFVNSENPLEGDKIFVDKIKEFILENKRIISNNLKT